ncbi:N-acetyltransferase [Erysipelothrix urinaevulpis]|uniref:GNAT family N-acetyltransferase n=1 Tax=Erysipelothrix urinaevulpis TaxID=2683717 RepID=UPI00135CB635|nr:GNAT family N-acetyltransferase [Erysipelothrix urinaevulpis]
MIIKRYQETMIHRCVEIYINTFTQAPWFDKIDNNQKVYHYFQNAYQMGNSRSYVFIKDDEIVGFCVGFLKPWIEGIELYIDEICIDYNHQRQGYGDAFLNAIINDLKEDKIESILLNTDKNTPAYNYYKKHGFKEIENLVILTR